MAQFLRLDKPMELFGFPCGLRTFKKDETHDRRTPEFSTLLLVFSGTLSFTEDGKRIDVPAGRYYIQRQGTAQDGLPITDPPVYGYVHFIAEYDDCDDKYALPICGSINTEIMRYEMLRFDDLRNKRHGTETLYRFYKILHILHKNRHNPKNDIAVKLHDYIAANASTVTSVEQLARHFNYSREYISRIFKNEYGITLHKFINKTRIQTACRLIKTTNLSAAQIAETCGYSDFSVFWRSFKSVTGKTPTEVKNDRNFEFFA